MVSTRGVRYKFSEGERVLCYEPDPTKAKVLYDSKVLEVIESKDKRGRRTVEYLIHFQGWNSSWDRCVSEDFVLKDTEENRQLQRDLAEKSQLQLGAYLYRRERKKGGSASGGSTAACVGAGADGAGAAKRARHGLSDDGSSSSTQPDETEPVADAVSASSSESGSESDPGTDPPLSPVPPAQPSRSHIQLPAPLRDRLTYDYHLVMKRGRLSRLPASPTVAEILQAFVKWYARAGAWHPPRSRHDPPHKPDLRDVSRRLNLVREVADGLRVYFDFMLELQLLYKHERAQYHEAMGRYSARKEELKTQGAPAIARDPSVVEHDIKSPKIPEYAHLPPDPADGERNGGLPQNSGKEEPLKDKTNNEKPVTKSETGIPEESQTGLNTSSVRVLRPATRSGNVARRLRSYKSAVSQSDNEELAPSTSTGEPRTFETLSSSIGSSASSVSECWVQPMQRATSAPSTRTPLSLLLDRVAKWELIPSTVDEPLPCKIYGAVHLARLFVKMPEFFNLIPVEDSKLKILVKHIELFVQYVNEHHEWFSEDSYFVADENATRSR